MLHLFYLIFCFLEGGKKFLFGDQACEYDCSVFGMLAQFLWQMPETVEETYMKGKITELI